MSSMKNYSKFILLESDGQVEEPVKEPVDTIQNLFKQLQDKIKQKKEEIGKVQEVQPETQVQKPIEGIDDKDTIKELIDKIKEMIKTQSKDELADTLTKCGNLIKMTEKEIKGVESLKSKSKSINRKMNILKRNIQLLNELKTDIVNNISKQ